MRLAPSVVDCVVTHARSAVPAECCGLLLGRDDDVVMAFAARNIAATPASRFLIDPADHFTALREARRRGLSVIGFYHSHPRSAAEPSATDEAEASYDGYLYLIVGLAAAEPDIKLYRLDRGALAGVAFHTAAAGR
jgi:proteasome lid subunit RPN8/RPN11